MDEFNFGAPGRRGPRVELDARVLVGIGVLLAAGLAVYGFLAFVSKGGTEVADAQVSAVQQVDHTQDAVAQTTLRNAMAAAASLLLERQTYDGLGAADLAGVEPSMTYTDGPSSNPQTVSVAMDGGVAGLAALSSSGTCFYLRDDVTASTTDGTVTTCTGRAALAAAAASW